MQYFGNITYFVHCNPFFYCDQQEKKTTSLTQNRRDSRMNLSGFRFTTKNKVLLAVAACVLYVSWDNIFSSNLDTGRALLADAEANAVNPEEKQRELQAFSPVISVLISPQTNIDELCHSLRSLRNVRGNMKAPVLTFHIEEPTDETKDFLKGCSTRQVLHTTIDMDDFPEGFEPEPDKDYTSAQINRFWTSKIWDHPALAPFDIVMRFDHDSCFSSVLANVPGFSGVHHVYSSQFFPGTYELNIKRLKGMFENVVEYLSEYHIQPKYPKMWQHVINTVLETDSIPNFQDTFEISSKAFMQSPAVSYFHHNLTDAAPYGYFTEGWNVDAERFLTAAIFGSKNTIDIAALDGFVQKDIAAGRVHPHICHFDAA